MRSKPRLTDDTCPEKSQGTSTPVTSVYLEEANENIESGGGVGNQLAVDVLAEGGEKARARLSIFISYQLAVFISYQGRLTNVHKQNTVASQKYCRMSNLHDNRSSLQTIP